MNDRDFMRRALELAARGRGYVSPNPMVGAVVVKDGRIIGEGYHQALGRAHAEVNAIDDAGTQSRGADLYVTLEPCNHTGRTPPCTRKILDAGIRRVVVAMEDPNPAVAGGGNEFLKAHGLEVVCGVCRDESRLLNESFIKHTTTGRPFVILKCAATLDGQIATRSGDARWISGPASRRIVHQLRHSVDAILVGINTVRVDNPRLTTRLTSGRPARDPLRVILDTHLSIDEDAAVLRVASDSDTLIFTGPEVSAVRRRRIADTGARIQAVPVVAGHVDIDAVMAHLGRMDVASCLIEGGSRISAAALAAGVIDKLMLFLGPKLLGGSDGVPLFRGRGAGVMAEALMLGRMHVRRIENDVLIEGYLEGTGKSGPKEVKKPENRLVVS